MEVSAVHLSVKYFKNTFFLLASSFKVQFNVKWTDFENK